jgi:hypothetical protein
VIRRDDLDLDLHEIGEYLSRRRAPCGVAVDPQSDQQTPGRDAGRAVAGRAWLRALTCDDAARRPL